MIHKFYMNGYYIVLDVHSGSVHIVDEVAYAILDLLELNFNQTVEDIVLKLENQYNQEEIRDSYEEIRELHENGMLFTEDDYQRFSEMMVSAPIKSMCLHIAHDCNLRCKYCFAATGDFGHGRKLMSAETGKKAIDFLLEHSQNRKNLELDFFGGEPLMNFQVVKEIVEYARSKEDKYNKNFRFTITTNGMLLSQEKINFINQEMSNVVLSLDGRKSVNDDMRPCINGAGSYEIIVDKYKKLVDNRGDKEYYLRGTFTKSNLDFSEDVIHMADLGFDQLSMEPVVADENKDYALTSKELPQIFNEYEKLACLLIDRKKNENGFNFFHFALDLDQGPCAIKRLRGCGCGNEYVAITPDGDIYPCHQFVGMEEWKMGDLETGIFDKKIKNYFSKTTIYHKNDCQDCWAKFYCSGGCNANNYQYEGDVLNPHKISCEMEKKRLECAIMIRAAMAEEEVYG